MTTLSVCDRCGVAYVNIEKHRAVSDGNDERGRPFYVCTLVHRFGMADVVPGETCGGRIVKRPGGGRFL